MDSESGTRRQSYLSPLCSDLPGLTGKEEGVGGSEDSLRGPAQRAFVTLIECVRREWSGRVKAFYLTQAYPVDIRDRAEQVRVRTHMGEEWEGNLSSEV